MKTTFLVEPNEVPMMVFEFDTMPEVPVKIKNKQVSAYAEALTSALLNREITKPGKYGIRFTATIENTDWFQYEITNFTDTIK